VKRLSAESSYDLLLPIASGGMASVYVGRKRGAAGFTRLVAIKRAHDKIAADPRARGAIIEEARIASQMHHPNVVAVHDVEELDGELLLVMDYIDGVTVAELVVAANEHGAPVGPDVALRIALDACAGLHAAHTLLDDHGEALAPVHRDVSPQNILVGLDGVSRVTDFGIAKSLVPDRMRTSRDVLKGKVAYMAPEYIVRGEADARVDVFAMGVVTWELLANARLFRGLTDAESLRRVRHDDPPALASLREGLPMELDAVLEQALAKLPDRRFANIQPFMSALESVAKEHDMLASAGEVARTVKRLVGERLDARREKVRAALRAEGESERDADEITTAVRLAPVPPDDSPTEITKDTRTVMTVRSSPNAFDEESAAEPPVRSPPPSRSAPWLVGAGVVLVVAVIAFVVGTDDTPAPDAPAAAVASSAVPPASLPSAKAAKAASSAPAAPPEASTGASTASQPSAEPAAASASTRAASPTPKPPQPAAPKPTAKPRFGANPY
jgi:serine/threonine-protein kinase